MMLTWQRNSSAFTSSATHADASVLGYGYDPQTLEHHRAHAGTTWVTYTSYAPPQLSDIHEIVGRRCQFGSRSLGIRSRSRSAAIPMSPQGAGPRCTPRAQPRRTVSRGESRDVV